MATGGFAGTGGAMASGLGNFGATWQQPHYQSLGNGMALPPPLPAVDPLTKSEIAFEIEGVFYNTLGAEIGRLGDRVNIFHLNEVEDDDLQSGAGLQQEAEEEEEEGRELDLEESQVIADQQLIASQLVSYLDLMQREGGDVNLEDIEQLSMQMQQMMPHLGSHSQLSSATTSYQGTRINTPAVASAAAAAPVVAMAAAPVGTGGGEGMASMPNLLPPVRSTPGSAADRASSAAAAEALVRPTPLPASRESQGAQPPPAMATPSKLSYQQMQANWDAIEGI